MKKGRSTDLPISDGALRAGTADDCFFDAVMAPNRSLPNSGFFMVMAVVVSVYLAGSVFFLSLGAWPVICFFGLDILLVWGAFKLSYRQGRLRERVFSHTRYADCVAGAAIGSYHALAITTFLDANSHGPADPA